MKRLTIALVAHDQRKVDMVEPLKAVLISTPMGGLNKEKGRR